MKRTGIIGLGVISKYYKKGLEASSYLSLTAVCDINDNAVSRSLYFQYPFYTDYIQMIEKENIEYVVISTEPSTHYTIAKSCLNHGVSVIVEKPAATHIKEYDELADIAMENGLVFEVMYHFQTAPEVLGFNKYFDSSRISSANIEIYDPYSIDGKTIIGDRQCLCGAWLDSGVNALSMLKCWLPFEKVELISHNTNRCSDTSYPIFADVSLLIDGVKVNIKVNWQKQVNLKTATLVYDGNPMIINSTEQKIIYKDKEYNFASMERLQAHYYNYFKIFKGESKERNSRKINETLLFVNEKL